MRLPPFLFKRYIPQLFPLCFLRPYPEQPDQFTAAYSGLRIEITGCHIIQHAAIQLTHFRLVIRRLKIRHAHQQFPFPYRQFEYQPQLMVPLDIVDNLYDGTVAFRKIVQNQGITLLHNREPLPIRMEIRRKGTEQRMARVDQ